ncbi:hypothetical protein N2599_19075 [Rhizobium sullae]|uniref:Uncharacterized protein n=1 Tax=Rhizobium sullae TaxID=50338 RepID=A0A2N0DCW6_RHISU|nr:hypothetical protein [Rhizobium sullae]PKA43951.1 hypothetical protein CWR43_06460 [Rhizobium sullae]UWU14190.1 hypothetical protein N2599_19075 [Rhizobium sullae]
MSIDLKRIDETRLREIWSVHEFARQCRQGKMEESRLKMLHGPFAEMHELTAGPERKASVW